MHLGIADPTIPTFQTKRSLPILDAGPGGRVGPLQSRAAVAVEHLVNGGGVLTEVRVAFAWDMKTSVVGVGAWYSTPHPEIVMIQPTRRA